MRIFSLNSSFLTHIFSNKWLRFLTTKKPIYQNNLLMRWWKKKRKRKRRKHTLKTEVGKMQIKRSRVCIKVRSSALFLIFLKYELYCFLHTHSQFNHYLYWSWTPFHCHCYHHFCIFLIPLHITILNHNKGLYIINHHHHHIHYITIKYDQSLGRNWKW